MDTTRDLISFIDASPSPFHCVAETRGRLDEAGFESLDEHSHWDPQPGGSYYVERGGGSITAFRVGTAPPAEGGFRIVGAHTDSPNLRLKPIPEQDKDGYSRGDVEVYGGAIVASWTDRDLGLAGRVVVEGEGLEERLVLLDRPIARIPNVAIHLNRKVNEEGLKVDKHKDLGPTLGISGDGGRLMRAVAASAQVELEAIRGFDLCFYDLMPGAVGGLEDEFVFSARLDNQAMCHGALAALLEASARPSPPASTAVVALFDHEEVGSRSHRGAEGPFLRDVLGRLSDDIPRAMATSLLVSADMAHAVHPSQGDLHDGQHLPRLNAGPVIKTNANQRYATDAWSGARFRQICQQADVPFQEFVVRADMACGSTIGPITAADLGIPTVDVGNPMLSMHSAREMSGASDPSMMVKVLTHFFSVA